MSLGTKGKEGEVDLFDLYQQAGGDSRWGDFVDYLVSLEEQNTVQVTGMNRGVITPKPVEVKKEG